MGVIIALGLNQKRSIFISTSIQRARDGMKKNKVLFTLEEEALLNVSFNCTILKIILFIYNTNCNINYSPHALSVIPLSVTILLKCNTFVESYFRLKSNTRMLGS